MGMTSLTDQSKHVPLLVLQNELVIDDTSPLLRRWTRLALGAGSNARLVETVSFRLTQMMAFEELLLTSLLLIAPVSCLISKRAVWYKVAKNRSWANRASLPRGKCAGENFGLRVVSPPILATTTT